MSQNAIRGWRLREIDASEHPDMLVVPREDFARLLDTLADMNAQIFTLTVSLTTMVGALQEMREAILCLRSRPH